MVKIITGKINSGKTTKIREYYNKEKIGDGIISRKVMLDKNVLGFNALRLSDNFEFPLMIHEKFYKQDVLHNGSTYDHDFIYQIGPYKIYKKAVKEIHKLYKQMFKRKLNPIYFDEVGKLELQEKGCYKLIKKSLKLKKDLIISIREDFIEEVLNKFNITEYEIVSG